ncbi:MAG: hypothetical protein LBF54_03560 [Holosporaceae bacterium]|jgi:hypothetical protein|nr:hypothetical protein [Holosporaceae bacterium]
MENIKKMTAIVLMLLIPETAICAPREITCGGDAVWEVSDDCKKIRVQE